MHLVLLLFRLIIMSIKIFRTALIQSFTILPEQMQMCVKEGAYVVGSFVSFYFYVSGSRGGAEIVMPFKNKLICLSHSLRTIPAPISNGQLHARAIYIQQ